MSKVRLFSERHFDKGCILALGTFDGVHKGHRELLNKALEMGRQLNLSAGVFFFSFPPVRYFCSSFPGVLTLPEEKELIFREYGFDFTVCADFDELRNMSAGCFIDTLVNNYGCRGVVCGENFTFGKDCSGSLSMLRNKFGSNFRAVALYPENGETVSSSVIRQFISEGFPEKAAAMLGRPYSLSGKVVHGREDGRKIGFPTANIVPDGVRLLPGGGVYVTKTSFEGQEYLSVTDIGYAPTVTSSGIRTVETHIPGFSGDIYGKTVTVSFIRKIRDETRFSSVDELKMQLRKDIDFAMKSISLGNDEK